MSDHPIIFDWNLEGDRPASVPPVKLHDETLRDGLQSPSVHNPTLAQKLSILRLLHQVGVDSADLGLPGAGGRANEDVHALLCCIRDEQLAIRPTIAARTHPSDIAPAVQLAQDVGIELEAMVFLGCSPIRMLTESWDEAMLEAFTRRAIRQCREGGLAPAFVTEDTTRSRPETLRRLFTAAIEEGATALVLCDTVGHVTPSGVRHLVRWTDAFLREQGVREQVRLDWHGHDDRGLGLVNGLAAAAAGIDQVHGTILGIGERVGNTSLDHLMVNLRLYEANDRDLRPLAQLVHKVSEACQVPIPVNYPVFGADAFRTGTGVHAAAVLKAREQGREDFAERVYSAVPPSWVGRKQEITIGYMSGASNVRHWLLQHGHEPSDALIEAILSYAKSSRQMLTDSEIEDVIASSHNDHT